MSGSAISRKKEGIEEAPLGSELMLFEPETSKFFVLNETMAFVWRNIDGADKPALVKALVDKFDGVETGTAQNDVAGALDQLVAMGLIIEEK